MRATNASLSAVLASNTRFAADLYTLYLASGTVRWTSAPSNIQMCNRILRSQEFDNASWIKRGTVTITANGGATAPDGTSTADRVNGLGTILVNDLYQTASGFSANQSVTPSVWIKRVSATGTVSIVNPMGGPTGSMTVDLAALGTEWVRVTPGVPGVTLGTAWKADASGSSGLHFAAASGTPVFDVWGAQIERGTSMTGYQPTTTAVVDTTWSSSGPVITRGTARCTAGLEIDTLDINLAPNGTTLGGLNLRAAALAGFLDNIRVVVQRAYMTTWGAIPLTVTAFDGLVVGVRPSSTEVVLTLKSAVAHMARPLPNRILQPQCPFTLFDANCGLIKGAYSVARAVQAGSTASTLIVESTSVMINLGAVVRISDGTSPYYQMQRTISAVAGTSLTLASPFPDIPATGTGIVITKACDKTRTACRLFSNIAKFGGFPDAPKPDSWSK